MKRNEFVKALCNFQYWLHKEHGTISTSSVDMTERALKFVESKGQNLPIQRVSNRLIDKVTTTNLDLAFRMVGISCDKDTVDKIIDLVELIESKGDDTSMKDVIFHLFFFISVCFGDS